MAKAADARSTTRDRAERAGGRGEVGGFQATFKIPGRVSVGASEGAKIACASRPLIIAPDLAIRSVPVLDPTAFLEASFKQAEDAPLLPGRVAIYRDGVFVGRGQMAAAGKDETVRLGFGADDKVKIERTVRQAQRGLGGLDRDDLEDRRSARSRPAVRNGHDFPHQDRDRGPVAGQRERGHRGRDAAVDARRRPRPICATGAACWNGRSRPRPARSSDISFAWRVRWPKDKGVVMVPAG